MDTYPVQSESRTKAIDQPIYIFDKGYKCTNAVFNVHELELEHISNPQPLGFRYVEYFILEIGKEGKSDT